MNNNHHEIEPGKSLSGVAGFLGGFATGGLLTGSMIGAFSFAAVGQVTAYRIYDRTHIDKPKDSLNAKPL